MTHPGAIAWFAAKPLRKAERRTLEQFRVGNPARRKNEHLDRKRMEKESK